MEGRGAGKGPRSRASGHVGARTRWLAWFTAKLPRWLTSFWRGQQGPGPAEANTAVDGSNKGALPK